MSRVNRLGCMTIPAILATIITMLMVAGSVFANGSAFFSPGDLSARSGAPLGNITSHAQIANACEQCHTAPWDTDTMQNRCIRCHTNIGIELTDPNKLHGILADKNGILECRKCHPEHRGAGETLTDVTLTNFPHELLGFATTSHKTLPDGTLFTCQNCHVKDYKSFKVSDCADCHRKLDTTFMTVHIQQYGPNCLSCHDGKESIDKKFDHSKTGFTLVDVHATLDCAKCHTKARTLADFKTSAAKCVDCHLKDNKHGPNFGTTCDACHTQKSWKDAHFDHKVTGFPLLGKHEKVACAKCHTTPDNFKNAPTTCVGCHQKDDKHNGTEGSACETCHTSDGWKPSTFNHFNVFPLEGKHAALLCQNCHTTPDHFKDAPATCFGCHQKDDAHKGDLGTSCGTCHNTTAWKPATFDHNLAAFRLTGAHVAVKCVTCHINGKFKGTPMTCIGCHQKDDKHAGTEGTACQTCHTTTAWKPSSFNHFNVFPLNGKHATLLCQNCHATPLQFKGAPTTCFGCHQKDDAHKGAFGTVCSTCHNSTAWKPATFDHNLAAFKLTGAHVNVKCETCHINGKFKGTPMTCVGCHQAKDVHGGAEGTACQTCHTTTAWKPSTFNHFNVFPLSGAHASLVCAKCHVNAPKFNNTPMTCVGCHQKDDAHNGGLGTNCATCHNSTAWKPASFDHNLAAFKLTGAHVTVQCALCHINGKFKGTPMTCIGCHQAKDVHAGAEGTACQTCHTTTAWKPSTFNHFNVFPLSGAHASLVCAKCHVNAPKFNNTPMTCVGCHQKDDAHNGGLGTNCATCHNSTAWKPASFDHNLAAFKLTGAHVTVQCTLCHINGKFKGTPMTCIGCHQAKDVHAGTEGTACESCHTTTAWKPSTFNHFNVFKLDGAHASVLCAKCHLNAPKFNNTPMTCIGCHQKDDAHGGAFGTLCATCHTTTAWKIANFDHNQFPFKLTGAHVGVTCTKCHTNSNFKATPTTCVSCHLAKDVHAGTEGTACEKCHTTTAWKPSTFNHSSVFTLVGAHTSVLCAKCHLTAPKFNNTPTTCIGCHKATDAHGGTEGTACETCHTPTAWKPSTFNHNNAAFKLTGAHTSVLCAKCHLTPDIFKPTASDCYSCHKKDDHHAGAYGPLCATCHSTTAWLPATFDHNLSAFKLTGKHTTVACTSCHINGVFKGTPMTCVGCHLKNDVHAGGEGTACANCHTTAAWKPSTFNHSTVFTLVGAHTSVLCAKCHLTAPKFNNTPTTCIGCHKATDAHGGTEGTACETCHTPTAWKPSTFNHNNAAFKLTGAHTSTLCAKCHLTPDIFKPTASDCYSCHKKDDHHAGAFGTSCGTCHSTTAWLPASFDHNLSAFKLTGAHASVACASCHINNVFKGTPTTCYACHKAKDVHAGTEGTACEGCHTTTAWKPSTFNHNNAAFKLTGAHTGVACASCHTTAGKFKGTPSTCVSCHADPAWHLGSFGTDCASCHTTTNWTATYSGSHPAVSNDGGGKGVNHGHTDCKTCHTVNVHAAICTACHKNGAPNG